MHPNALPQEVETLLPLQLVTRWRRTETPGVDVRVDETGQPVAVRYPVAMDTEEGRSEVRFEVFRVTGRLVSLSERHIHSSGLVCATVQVREDVDRG